MGQLVINQLQASQGQGDTQYYVMGLLVGRKAKTSIPGTLCKVWRGAAGVLTASRLAQWELAFPLATKQAQCDQPGGTQNLWTSCLSLPVTQESSLSGPFRRESAERTEMVKNLQILAPSVF